MTERATDSQSVDDLAGRAIRMVASRGLQPAVADRDGNIRDLRDAAVNGSRETCLEVVTTLIESGVAKTTIADDYIPEIARQMGDAWCVDDMSFAAVTIGVSRLQSLLRDLGPEWRADTAADPNAGAALIVVALDEYHTLGAMVLAGRLRRAGLSVRLQLGLSPAALRDQLDPPRFQAILISASRGESLETLRLLVEAVRASASSGTPVVIGGSILEDDKDVKAHTGADYVTSDPVEALKNCGLKIPTPIDAPLAPET